jgi:hypothetical protein
VGGPPRFIAIVSEYVQDCCGCPSIGWAAGAKTKLKLMAAAMAVGFCGWAPQASAELDDRFHETCIMEPMD